MKDFDSKLTKSFESGTYTLFTRAFLIGGNQQGFDSFLVFPSVNREFIFIFYETKGTEVELGNKNMATRTSADMIHNKYRLYEEAIAEISYDWFKKAQKFLIIIDANNYNFAFSKVCKYKHLGILCNEWKSMEIKKGNFSKYFGVTWQSLLSVIVSNDNPLSFCQTLNKK